MICCFSYFRCSIAFSFVFLFQQHKFYPLYYFHRLNISLTKFCELRLLFSVLVFRIPLEFSLYLLPVLQPSSAVSACRDGTLRHLQRKMEWVGRGGEGLRQFGGIVICRRASSMRFCATLKPLNIRANWRY